jgi:hypothetical protein
MLRVLRSGELNVSMLYLVALCLRAVNELLLGQRHEVSGLDGMRTLGGTGGGERPTRAALLLILHRGDGVLGSPVNGGGNLLDGGVRSVLGAEHALVDALVAGHLGVELSEGHVSELVHSHGEAVVLVGVVVTDLVEVCLEDGVTREEFIVGVLLVVLLHERSELTEATREAEHTEEEEGMMSDRFS